MGLEVDRGDAVRARAFEPVGHEVDGEHVLDAAVLRDPAAHLADRSEAEDEQAAAGGTSAYSTACQAVGSTSER